MAKTKTRYIEINVQHGGFVSRLIGRSKEGYDFSDMVLLRKLLSNEKAKILYILKQKKPKSIYALAKLLGRDFKSVSDDTKLLERFGFLEFHPEKHGERSSLAPVLAVDRMELIVSI